MKLVRLPLQDKHILLIHGKGEDRVQLVQALSDEGATPTVLDDLGRLQALPALPQAQLVLFEDDMSANGLSELRTLREHPALAHSAIVLLTARCDRGCFSQALELGADDVIQKPLQHEDMLSRVHCHIRLQSTVQELDRKQRDAGAVLELTQALSSSHDLQEILFTVVERIAEVVNVSRASIVLSPEPGEDAVGFVVATSDDMRLSNLRIDLSRYPEIQEVLKTCESLTISDVKTHPLLDRVRGQVPSDRVASMSLIPIVWQEQASGVLFLRAGEGRGRLSELDLHFCQIVANTTAIALRNARIMQSLRDHTQKVTFARFEAERKLRALERYADLFNSLTDGVVVLDENGKLLFANPRAYQMLGQDWESYTGKPIMNLVHPDDQTRARNMWKEFLDGLVPRETDFRLIRPNLPAIVASVAVSRLLHREGAMLITFRDVTETRRIESELVRTKDFLESLIEASVDGIVACDMSRTVVLFNPSAERIFGRKSDAIPHRTALKELLGAAETDRIIQLLQSDQQGGVGRLHATRVDAVGGEGETIPLSLSAALVMQDGEPHAIFLFFNDLRDRLQMEERLAHAQQKLAVTEKQALIAELAGTAAHELNQPLTSVMGYGEMLKRKLEHGSSEFNASDIIVREAERMAEIVRNIGRITKYETKSYVGNQRILDLDASIGPDAEHSGEES